MLRKSGLTASQHDTRKRIEKLRSGRRWCRGTRDDERCCTEQSESELCSETQLRAHKCERCCGA